MLDTTDLVGLLSNGNRASELSSATTANNVVILDHVADDADSVVQATLGLITDGLGATTDHNCDSLGVLTLLDEDDFIARCAVSNLFDATGDSELFRSNLLEARDNAGTCCDGEELNLNTTDPSDRRELVLHEQVVGLVIETPLAKDGSCARIFDTLYHIGEVVLLHLLKLGVVSSALDLETVLGLRLRGLERASEDADLGVLDLLSHLRVGELLVDNDTFDEARVFDGATGLGDDLDEVEVDVTALNVSNVKHSLQGKVSVVVLARADDLGAEGGLGASPELGVVVLEDVELLLDLVNLSHGNITSLLETISDFKRVDALFQKFLGLLKNGTGKDDNTSGAVTDFVVLRGGKLGEEPCSLVMNL